MNRSIYEKIKTFIASKSISYWNYKFLKNPGQYGIKSDELIKTKGGYESKAPDGFIIGNKECLAAIGCPAVAAESVYNYYNDDLQDNVEYIDLLMSPSRMSVLIGPEKRIEHLKILFNEMRFQDLIISYKINGEKRGIPLWSMENRFLKRFEKTRIVISEFFNKEIRIQIISFALKVPEKRDIPVIPRIIVIDNITNSRISKVRLGIVCFNMAFDWEIAQKENSSRIDIGYKNQPVFWSVLLGNSNQNRNNDQMMSLKDLHYEDFEEFNSEFGNNPLKIYELMHDETENQKSYSSVGMGIIVSDLGDIESNNSLSFDFTIIPSKNENSLENTLKNLESYGLYASSEKSIDILHCLTQTFDEWIDWFERVEIQVSDEKIFGLIDSLLTMLRCVVSNRAIHIGTLYYSHNSAFWRDNYWIQNAFLKAGRYEYSRRDLNFFHSAWKKRGFKNSYSILPIKGHSANSREIRSEIPLYSVLMVRNLFKWLNDSELLDLYRDMISESIDESLYAENNLCLLNSDETWIWPCYVNEHDYYIDNSLISLCAYNFAAQLCRRKEYKDKLNSWNKKKNDIIDGLVHNLILKEQFRFATGIDNNGYQDESLVTTLSARPLLLNLKDILEPIIKKDLNITFEHAVFNALCLIWDVMKPTRVIRSHTRTSAIEGNTIGHYLEACSELDVPFLEELLTYTLDFSNCTGSVNEIHDMYNHKWGTGKQRTWDSSSLLSGLIHYLFGVTPYRDHVEFNPHLPKHVHSSKFSNFRVHDFEVIISCHKHGDNMERSVFLKDIKNENFQDLGMPIPEIGVLRTNLPGKFIVYDGEISRNKDNNKLFSNYFATTLKIKQRFIDTNTDNQDIPLFSIENPLITGQKYWKIFIYRNHLKSLTYKKYTIDLPAHKIQIAINNYTDEKSEKYSHIIVQNSGKIPIRLYVDVSDHTHYDPIKSEQHKSINLRLHDIEHSHEHHHGHEEKHSDKHHHEHEEKHSYEHHHHHAHKPQFDYPFKDIYSHIITKKPYWKPHPLIQNLEKTLFQANDCKEQPVVIVCDDSSLQHAKQVYKMIAIIKQMFIPIFKVESENNILKSKVIEHEKKSQNVILILKRNIEEIYGKSKYQTIIDSKSKKPISCFKILQNTDTSNKNQYVFYIKNNGHCYQDTHKFCGVLNTYLMPQRKKAIAMYPYGLIALSDIIGDKITEKLPVTVRVLSQHPINMYIQDKDYHDLSIDSEIDCTKYDKSNKVQKPYINISAVNGAIPLEIAAGGIAKGTNCMKLFIEGNSDVPITVEIKFQLPQNFEPIWLMGKQRERTIDKTELIKNSDGKKTMKILLNLGKPVHKYLRQKSLDPKERKLEYLFGKYPKYPKDLR
ncbi:MAG: hypothetical protein GF364_00640 [Candidatus Lokiarchaeota archaeon]|nr:hypothetical protein [Candidatus Lokiarchaeota archaeon]